MDIRYDQSSKSVRCYRDFVMSPEGRGAARSFRKIFGENLMSAAVKLHDRLIKYPSAGSYNAIYGSTDNRIEIKRAVKAKEDLVVKGRYEN